MNRLLEVTIIFLIVEIRIWLLDGMGFITFLATALPICLALYSWYKREYRTTFEFYSRHARESGAGTTHREVKEISLCSTFHQLGLRPMNFWQGANRIIILFLIAWLILLFVGIVFNPVAFTNPVTVYIFSLHCLGYFFWGLLQQLWLNGYFVNRISAVLSRGKTTFIAGLLFAIVHLPNPVLFVATLLGGWISADFFQKNRNIYVLAFCHAILAVTIKYFLPGAWHHNLMIGPGYLSFDSLFGM